MDSKKAEQIIALDNAGAAATREQMMGFTGPFLLFMGLLHIGLGLFFLKGKKPQRKEAAATCIFGAGLPLLFGGTGALFDPNTNLFWVSFFVALACASNLGWVVQIVLDKGGKYR